MKYAVKVKKFFPFSQCFGYSCGWEPICSNQKFLRDYPNVGGIIPIQLENTRFQMITTGVLEKMKYLNSTEYCRDAISRNDTANAIRRTLLVDQLIKIDQNYNDATALLSVLDQFLFCLRSALLNSPNYTEIALDNILGTQNGKNSINCE